MAAASVRPTLGHVVVSVDGVAARYGLGAGHPFGFGVVVGYGVVALGRLA